MKGFLKMENVKNIYITGEVAQLLDYEPAHVIRVAKDLLLEGVFTENDFRSAGPRTYLFNSEAIKQLRIKFDCPTAFLVSTLDEQPHTIENCRYSELRVVEEDLIILHDAEEKAKFQALLKSFNEGDNEEDYEEFINEKDYLKEFVASDDPYGWISYIKLDKAIREGSAYFINDLDLTLVKPSDLDKMVVTIDETRVVSEVVTQLESGFFESTNDTYYRFTGNGTEVEEIDVTDERIKYWKMSVDEALDQIAKDFKLQFYYDRLDYWDNQPFFLTVDELTIAIKEIVIENGAAHLKTRNLSEILDDVMAI